MASISLLIIAICTISLNQAVAQSSLQTYIVHLNPTQARGQSANLDTWYKSFLSESTTNSSNPSSRIVRTYKNVITGFAAKLTAAEVKEMTKKQEFLHAIPERTYALHTTHSPNFLGLYRNLGSWPRASYGKGVIIGVLDTGITPGHPSFNDDGVPPPPAKWKGKCEFNGTACNNKLIGARNFVGGSSAPPIDDEGHGTHTASTAAGNFVAGANVFGQANGTASGMAPLAHLAIYKVCSGEGCFDSDILAAMDAAIEDGVDILSLSLGGPSLPFYEDNIAIAAFSAVEKGIFVSCSAGNGGPSNSTLSNEAPWILTVGASTIDRSITATALLGNGYLFDGESLYQPDNFPTKATLPLVYAGAGGDQNAAWCAPGSLSNSDVKGKVVLCDRGGEIARIAKGQTVKDAGGAAMILMNSAVDGYSTLADPHVLPATHVSYDAGELIKQYINSTSSPTATILFKGTRIGNRNAPAVTSFSSRGPNTASPGILKPDIIGPGVSILASWPISMDNYTDEKGTFNMISGTSMSCPHLSGIAALIKSMYPDWSPAMIKSAMMTTALQTNMNNKPILDERNLPADLFAVGAGHVLPPNALDPGLVHNISTRDYINYLCFLYTDKEASIITRRNISCNGQDGSGVPEAQLNYPSFAIQLGGTSYIYSRTVTNVATGPATYTLTLEDVPGVNVTVEPSVLKFTQTNQEVKYKIYVSRVDSTSHGKYVEGGITWVSVDTQHFLRIPVSVFLV